MNQKEHVDSQGRIWSTDKSRINELVELMNEGSLYPLPARSR